MEHISELGDVCSSQTKHIDRLIIAKPVKIKFESGMMLFVVFLEKKKSVASKLYKV